MLISICDVVHFTVQNRYVRLPLSTRNVASLVPLYRKFKVASHLLVSASMHLVQLLLPLKDNNGQAFPANYFQELRTQLTARFGGATAFVRSPAVGLWQDNNAEINRDDVVMFEVMTDELDTKFWNKFRRDLENKFRQDEILIRAIEVKKL